MRNRRSIHHAAGCYAEDKLSATDLCLQLDRLLICPLSADVEEFTCRYVSPSGPHDIIHNSIIHDSLHGL